jgi:hypothetical protein
MKNGKLYTHGPHQMLEIFTVFKYLSTHLLALCYSYRTGHILTSSQSNHMKNWLMQQN